MKEPGIITELNAEARVLNGNPGEETSTALEQRVRRLEDAVATIQDTRQLEERVVERVNQRFSPPNLQLAAPGPDSPPILVEAGRRLLPAALDLVRSRGPKPTPKAVATSAATSPDLRTPWLLVDIVSDLRGIWRMILDPHYRLTWLARAVLLGIVPFILTSSLWIPFANLPFVGSVLDKAIDIVLAFCAYKVLTRELALYRQVVADLPARYRSAV